MIMTKSVIKVRLRVKARYSGKRYGPGDEVARPWEHAAQLVRRGAAELVGDPNDVPALTAALFLRYELRGGD